MTSWRHKLPQYWHTHNTLTWLLWPIEVLYRMAFALRKRLYDMGFFKQHSVHATVIVVGNVVAGGGGKTPLTMALVQRLTQQGYKVGVISRGYGRQSAGLLIVQDHSKAADVGDEPLLIFQKCQVPVVVSSNRVEAAEELLKKFPETTVLVSDDGLQHWALHRDLEICVMDAMGIGNGHMLPAGPLREPWPRHVDLLLHTSQRSLEIGYASTRRLSDKALSSSGRTTSLHDLQSTPIEVVTGIAKPDAFFNMLVECGLHIRTKTALPDHDNFENWTPRHPSLALLCTEKDAVKIWPKHGHALAVPLIFEPETAFWDAFDACFQATHRYH